MTSKVYKIREIPRTVPVRAIVAVVEKAGGRFLERHLMGENHCSNVLAELTAEQAAPVVAQLQEVIAACGARAGKIRLLEIADFSSKVRRSQTSTIRIQIASPPSWALQQEGAETVVFALLEKVLAKYPYLEVNEKCLWMWSSRPNGGKTSRAYEVFVDLCDKHVARDSCNSWNPILDAHPLAVQGKTVHLHTLQPPQKPRLFAGRPLPERFWVKGVRASPAGWCPAARPAFLNANTETVPRRPADDLRAAQAPPQASVPAWVAPGMVGAVDDEEVDCASELASMLSRLSIRASQFDGGASSDPAKVPSGSNAGSWTHAEPEAGPSRASDCDPWATSLPAVASTPSSGSIGSCPETAEATPRSSACATRPPAEAGPSDWPEAACGFLFFCNAATAEGTCLNAFARKVKTDPPPFTDSAAGLDG
ncbi:hypothetical protein DIPPA_15141 [Diplonema papillatum]|nr:hypothetical protein DIPPA_15141 [Diplonema papillatum]|eukprot:gene14369-22039_t